MNIEEIAKDVGITSPDGFKLTVNPVQIDKLQAFAAAVIKAHTEELIAGVGEPHKCCLNCTEHGECHPNNERGCDYRPEFEYTKEQVAGAIAADRRKHKVAIGIANITIEAEGRRIAELEAENDRLSAHTAKLRYLHIRRIATLESTLKLALESLEEATTYTSSPSWSPSMTEECRKAADKIKEVLHD